MLIAVAAAPVPQPPLLCGTSPRLVTVTEDAPAIYADDANNTDQPGRVLVDGKAIYTFTDYGDVPNECTWDGESDAQALNDARPPKPDFVDPEYDEFDPVGPTEGPPGAGTVDHP